VAWSLPGLRPISIPHAPTGVTALAYVSRSHLFVIGVEGGFDVGRSLDLRRDHLIRTHVSGDYLDLNAAGTKLLIATKKGSELHIFSTSNGQPLAHFSVHPVGFHPQNNVLNDAEFSDDSSRIVVAESDGNAYVLDATSGAQEAAIGVDTGYLECANFAPNNDNEIVAGGSDGTARVWDVASNTPLQVLPDPRATSVTNCGFTRSGNEVVTSSDGGTLRQWTATPSEGALVREATAKIDRVAPLWVRNSLVKTCDCNGS
jgi:WD40 repeat protein